MFAVRCSLLFLLLLACPLHATNIGGNITSNTTWTLAGSPYVLTNTVAVTNNVTLTIDPGVVVQLTNAASITVRGRLLAEGTSANRIRFTRTPGSANWTRLDFLASPSESRITFADIEYPNGSGTVQGSSASIYLDNVVWTNTTAHLIHLTSCSLTLLNSTLPSINGAELITAHGMPANGHALIRSNVFGSDGSGVNDIIDWTGGQRPGPIIQIYDNIFTGGTDDGIDLDGTDAHIEGNIFMHFHASSIANADTASAISGGFDGPFVSRVVIARNLFYDCDHGILCKETNFFVIQNNTFVNMIHAVVNMNEPLRSGVTPGAGVILDGNIAWHCPTNFENFTTNAFGVNYNILSAPDHTNKGVGNLALDPLLVGTNGVTVDNIRALFALQTNSPALDTGPNGLDRGALVPAGASISGEPSGTTTNRGATLAISGPGIVAYRWRTNNGPWTPALSPLTNSFSFTTNLFANAVPITLSNLTDGTYTVYVLGVDSAGLVQDTNAPTVSKTWIVQLDTDGDGMPDAWELANGTDPNVDDANDDDDLDGLSNLQEYQAGTNPIDPLSTLRLDASALAPGNVLLSFAAVSNRVYAIESRVSLTTGAWTNAAEVPSGTTNRLVEITNALGADSQFYRLVTWPQ